MPGCCRFLKAIAVHSAQAGLEQAKIQPPDAILLDIMLPDMDGGELLRALEAECGLDLVENFLNLLIGL